MRRSTTREAASTKPSTPRKGFAADLVAHAFRVGESADDDFSVAVFPPAQDHAPAVKGGVLLDGGDASGACFAREEGCVVRARDEGPEWSAAEGVFLIRG